MMNENTVRVWDPFVRVFHWSLAILFLVAWLTGEESGWLHEWAGYGIVLLIVSRIAWGFVGGRYARFSQFVRSPLAALRYLQGLATGTAPRFVGHNPAGGWMALALLVTVLATSVSGVVVLALEGEGPLAGRIDAGSPVVSLVASSVPAGEADGEDEGEGEGEGEEGDEEEYGGTEYGEGAAAEGEGGSEGAEEAWEEVHEFLANLSLFLVIAHIIGVLASSMAHRENLVRAMITGRKRAS